MSKADDETRKKRVTAFVKATKKKAPRKAPPVKRKPQSVRANLENALAAQTPAWHIKILAEDRRKEAELHKFLAQREIDRLIASIKRDRAWLKANPGDEDSYLFEMAISDAKRELEDERREFQRAVRDLTDQHYLLTGERSKGG